MKTKEKIFLKLLLIIFVFLIIVPLSVTANTENIANVSTADEFKEAVQNSVSNINILADIDLTDAGVLDVSGMTINLNENKILADNFSLIFEGTNFTIKNGTFDAKGGNYALFLGDMGETDNVIIEDVTLIGGINVFNSTNVVLNNVDATGGPLYYAIWCDENGHVIVKSGNFKTNGNAVIGLATCDEPEGNATLDIEGGTYITNEKPLVLLGNYGIPKIKDGSFDVPVLQEYCAEGYEPVSLGENSYSVCNHSNTVIKEAISPTCVVEGYSGDIHCAKCDKLIENGETIQALGHNYSDWKFDKDNHWKECTNEGCNEIMPDSLVVHSYNNEGKCEVCSYENPDKKPEEPDVPEVPDKPEEPEKPIIPEEPNKPEKPVTPEKPDENDKTVKFLEDSKTHIKLEFKDNVLEKNTILEVLLITNGTTYEDIGKKLSDIEEFIVYDINLFRNGVKVQPNGKILISLPIPKSFDKTRLAIYRIDGANEIEYNGKVITIDNIDYIQFETDHFSNYVLVEKQVANTEDEKPKEEDKVDINKEPEQEKEPEHKLDDEPKTGMVGVAFMTSTTLSISLIGYVICKKKSVKK